MQLVYDLLSAIIVVISTTGLLIDSLKGYQYFSVLVYVMAMAELSSVTGLGQIVGVVMAPILFLFLALFIKKNRIWNLCLGCVGYLVNITFNNLMIYLVIQITKISGKTLAEKYWLLFSVVYIVLLMLLFLVIRKALIEKIVKNKKRTQVTVIGLFVNLILYLIIFVINISMGEEIGYSVQGIRFNIIMFAICLFVSSVLFYFCIKAVMREEERKAEEKQLEVLENYIKNLEQLNEKTSAVRHDYKNMLSGLSGFLKEGRIEEMKSYLADIVHTTDTSTREQEHAWKELSHVYPLELKGFLYEKILCAYAKRIKMQIQVDEKFHFKCNYVQDVIRILGIFIDNAIEETADMDNGYVMIIAVNTDQGVLFSVTNNFKKKPELSLMEQRGYTTKGEERGMGLYWVKELVKKHGIIHNVDVTDTEVIQEIEIIK